MMFSAAMQKPWNVELDAWNADFYHRVMGPQQLAAASQLFGLLADVSEGWVVDAGCGTGLVAAELLRSLPRVRLLAVDLSAPMLELARRALEQRFLGRVRFVKADLQHFAATEPVACIFSNATLHWVPDHTTMFANFRRTLSPRGLVASQFAWAGPTNLELFAFLRRTLLAAPFFLPEEACHWQVEAVTLDREAAALRRAGFGHFTLEPHHIDFRFANVDEQRRFTENVVMRETMAHMPTQAMRERFLDTFLAFTDAQVAPCVQRYESLRCVAHVAR